MPLKKRKITAPSNGIYSDNVPYIWQRLWRIDF